MNCALPSYNFLDKMDEDEHLRYVVLCHLQYEMMQIIVKFAVETHVEVKDDRLKDLFADIVKAFFESNVEGDDGPEDSFACFRESPLFEVAIEKAGKVLAARHAAKTH